MNASETRRALLAWLEEHAAFDLDLLPRGPMIKRQAGARPEDTLAKVPLASAPAEVADRAAVLLELAEEVRACARCGLCRGRQQAVPGEGAHDAEYFFVGEGPGAEEDREGRPFVGASGELLTKMIGAMGLARERVFIANVVKCRPPGNRDPQIEEVQACGPFLARQIAIVRPRIIITLGRFAAHAILRTELSLAKLRGRVHERDGIPVVPTYHPAYLLRTPSAKRDAWSDLKLALKTLEQNSPGGEKT